MGVSLKNLAMGVFVDVITHCTTKELVNSIGTNFSLVKDCQRKGYLTAARTLVNLFFDKKYFDEVLNMTPYEVLDIIKAKRPDVYALLSKGGGWAWYLQQFNDFKKLISDFRKTKKVFGFF